jgi:hypothetical protein
MTYQCEYCSREFKRESSLVKHMCTQKKRHLDKDTQPARLGLKFFNDWYRRAMGAKTNRTYAEFAKSRYYSAFVRFGLYVMESRVLAPERYLEWLIVHQIKLENWSKDSVYNRYLADQSKKETVERALERFVLHAESWSEKTGNHWSRYWQEISMNRLIHDIKMGKISPWILLSYPPAKQRLEELPDELVTEVADTIDLAYWQRKIEVNKPTVKWIQEVMP